MRNNENTMENYLLIFAITASSPINVPQFSLFLFIDSQPIFFSRLSVRYESGKDKQKTLEDFKTTHNLTLWALVEQIRSL